MYSDSGFFFFFPNTQFTCKSKSQENIGLVFPWLFYFILERKGGSGGGGKGGETETETENVKLALHSAQSPTCRAQFHNPGVPCVTT